MREQEMHAHPKHNRVVEMVKELIQFGSQVVLIDGLCLGQMLMIRLEERFGDPSEHPSNSETSLRVRV
jgi:hypothetical protein